MALGGEYFDPILGADAFEQLGRASRSRAVQLLLIAEQLSRPIGAAPPIAVNEEASLVAAPELYSDLNEFLRDEWRTAAVFSNRRSEYEPGAAAGLWTTARDTSDPQAAVELLALSLRDPSPFARLSAIVGLLAIGSDSRPYAYSRVDEYLLRMLFEEQYRAPNVTGTLARNLFDRIAGYDDDFPPPPDLSTRSRNGGSAGSAEPLSIGIHGTFSRYGESRVAPSHRFYEYLTDTFSPDLFPDEARYFRWSGRYSRYDRRKGARDLPLWLDRIGKVTELDTVYAHSHGGNVALTAAAAGVKINFLVLLSVPPIERSAIEWAAINQNVDYMFSLRTHLDRVVLIDLVASRVPAVRRTFNTERSVGLDFPPEANVHTASPIGWFSHTSWLDRHIWQTTTIESEVRNKYALTHPTI